MNGDGLHVGGDISHLKCGRADCVRTAVFALASHARALQSLRFFTRTYAAAARPKELTNSPFLTCGLRILRRRPPSHATTCPQSSPCSRPRWSSTHLGRCQPLETMSKSGGMQDASPIITSVWFWRPTVRCVATGRTLVLTSLCAG